MMTQHRHFLDWDAPVTQRVREFLLPESTTTYCAVNLQRTLIIVPTRQSARRLSEALVRHCATRNLAILGARIVPPTFLLQTDPPDPHIASDTVAAATWATILNALRAEEAPTLFPTATRRSDFSWALQSGRMLQQLRQTLSDGAYAITDVTQRFDTQLEERDRWNELAALESRYLSVLAQQGLRDPITARIAHATRGELPPDITRIVLAAVLEPSLLVIKALERAAQHIPVDILIHAPASRADTFDAWGRPLPEAWQDCAIPIPHAEHHVILESTPIAQSTRVASLLRTHQTPAAIGVPDPNITPCVAAACADAGFTTFDPADRPLGLHPLTVLVTQISELCANPSYAALSNYLRHADALDYFCSGAHTTAQQLLTELDIFQNAFLPADVAAVMAGLTRAAAEYPALQQAVTTLHAHLVALQSVAPATAMRAFLKAVYASRQLHPRRESDTEFQTVAGHIDTALREIEDAPEACLPPDPLHQLALLRLQLEDARYHPVARRADFDLEGWLELPWNNAPNLIVTGMNEGSVPAAQPRDPFLPDTLCALLGLRHDAARLARDACLMSALVASRAADGTATFIAGKVSATGDPLKPSRLLFRCTDAELPHRAARLFGPADAQRTSVPSAISFQLNSAPPPDLPRNALPVTRLSVTAFRAYLACPFRYYLQHVLRMEPLDDARTGLDARDFGTLTHAVLQTMATSGMWRCDDPAKLGAYLDAEVHTWMHARFGAQPPVVVSLAAEAARQRLRAAARQQARLNADGWEIMHTEAKVTASLGAMRIVGKIDRIDRHRKTGRWRVIDYKTSDTAVDPAAAHLASVRPETPEWMRLKQEKPRRWVDLQLPIYVWLLRNGSMELPAHAPTPPPGEPWEQVEVGYFNLPKAVADTSLTLWDGLEETMLSSAADCAREIVHRITGQLFWPPAERVEFENFDSLLLGNAAACMQPPITPPAMAKDAS